MKLLVLFFLLFSCSAFAQDVWVNGYYRSNGSYVSGHYRSRPNSTKNDNFSTVGNVNPYTGKPGDLPGGGNNVQLADRLPLPVSTVPSSSYGGNYIYNEIQESNRRAEFLKNLPTNTPTVEKPKRKSDGGGKYFTVSNGKRNYVIRKLRR